MVNQVVRPRRFRVGLFLHLCLIWLWFCVPAVAAGQAASITIDSEEQQFLKLINDYRSTNGLGPLKISIALTNAADWMSRDMAMKNYFSHTDSLGRDPFARMAAFNYAYQAYRGENLAAGYTTAAQVFVQWMNSPSHNAIMLNANFRVLGISREYNASALYRWYWTADFGGYVDATIEPGGTALYPVNTVNAANYAAIVAPDGLAASFGTQLSGTTMPATAQPLPTALGGTTVTINGVNAQLLYVSPGQINYLVPSGAASGAAQVRVFLNGNEIAAGTVTIDRLSPSLFTTTADGRGVPVAQTTYNGTQFEPVANADGSARAISVGSSSKPNYLVLYGTGWRRVSSLSNVRVTIGGLAATVTFAGAHSKFAGLDQLNVKLPLELRGRGIVELVLTVEGREANRVQLNIGL